MEAVLFELTRVEELKNPDNFLEADEDGQEKLQGLQGWSTRNSMIPLEEPYANETSGHRIKEIKG